MAGRIERGSRTAPVARAGTPGAVWCASRLQHCAPATLRVIASLLLEPCDLTTLATFAGRSACARPWRTVELVVARVPDDTFLAARLARRLARRAAHVGHLLACSPYEIVALWATQRRELSRQELGAMLARLACGGDPALTPLAQRLRHEVELDALRALPDHPLGVDVPR